jgi:hypothetical protein
MNSQIKRFNFEYLKLPRNVLDTINHRGLLFQLSKTLKMITLNLEMGRKPKEGYLAIL